MVAIKNMKLQTLVPEQFTAQSLPVESRRNIYLFCKEAINNAVKYSEATLLQLDVKESHNLFEITIVDNGKGFDVEKIKRGNGLDNMQKRADELNADYSVQSKSGEGCSTTLKVKITQ
jgi:signal transduction histidine kinase